jgi:hypothetical protein
LFSTFAALRSGSILGELQNPCLHLVTRDSWLTEFPSSKREIFNSPCTQFNTGDDTPPPKGILLREEYFQVEIYALNLMVSNIWMHCYSKIKVKGLACFYMKLLTSSDDPRVQFVCHWRPLAYNLHATGRQSHANFACDWRPVSAKPPVFCKHAARTVIWIKKLVNH